MSKNFIDLFSGTGAFSYVLEKNGFNCVFANDNVKSSKDIYDANNQKCPLTLEDIHNININDIPKHDILCAGFSCQPFSIAGQQKGFQDSRSNVFWKIIEILNIHKPNIIILENVKNLKAHDKGNTFKVIENNLTKLGYMLKYNILDTCKLTNVPHHRERIYIVGFLNKEEYDLFNFDFPIKSINSISLYLENDINDKYYYTDRFKVYDTIENEVTEHISDNILYQYRRYYVRKNKSKCCPTLTANMGGGGHNVPLIKDDNGIRKLTPRECFNLQGFPKDYKLPKLSDSVLYKLAGNAVSIPVVDLIIKKLL